MKTRAELDAMLRKTVEEVNKTVNLSNALKKAIAEDDIDTVNRLRVEMQKMLEEQSRKIKM